MTFIKKYNGYLLISVILIGNISCMHEIPRVEKIPNGQHGHGCDLIWNIRRMPQKEIFFHNTCTNQSCTVVWKSKNMLGIWSSPHYEHIPPKGELSYPVYFYETQFDVNYLFQYY